MMNREQPKTEYTPRVSTRIRRSSNKPLAIVSGLIIVVGIILSIIYFNFSLLDSLILIAALFVFYALLLILLIGTTRKVRQVVRIPVVKEIEKPIKIIEKPIIQVIPKQMPKAKHYKYVGSTTTKIYHQSSSRLARLIRPKNRIQSNSRAYFERLGFKPSEHIKAKLNKKTKKKRR